MDEQKNQEQPELNEAPEEYSFLQEVIKDEAGSPKRLKAKILRMIGLGFVFGIVACFSFCLLYPMVSEHLSGDPKEVTIPRDTEEEKETKNSGTVEEELSTEDFGVMMERLDGTARQVMKSMVEIQVVSSDAVDGKSENEKRTLSGVIVADNGQELLILSSESTGEES